MRQAIRNRLRREVFLTTPLAIVVNPFYIIRDGLFKVILKIAPRIKGNVLDFGCGSKPYKSLFGNASSYVGVDIEVSGHNHQLQDSKVDIFYDGKILPFPSDHFDAVVTFETLEHVFNLAEVLLEIRRVMKPNGLFLLSIPFAWDEHEVPFDFARYTSYGISDLLKKSGLEVVELNKTTTCVQAIFQVFIAYLFQYVLPRGRILNWISQIFVIFPLNLASLLANAILPKNNSYFSNLVVLARKI
jgi:SAM-dependent methyltransferase